MQYLMAWIASWVEEFGIDGFRCDIVENVHLNRWKELNDACNKALATWRRKHPSDSASRWADKFYMTGDFENSSIDRKSGYADAGFSSMVNFSFPSMVTLIILFTHGRLMPTALLQIRAGTLSAISITHIIATPIPLI